MNGHASAHPIVTRRSACAASASVNFAGVGERVEEGRRHLGAASVVHTGEEDRLHGRPLLPTMRSTSLATTRGATAGSVGTSQRKRTVAAPAPRSCAMMKPGASAGRIPAKVSVSDRATVTAGFAKDVEAVNQYADVM